MIFADLHIHSKYSRAVSFNMDLPHLVSGAKAKGLGLLGTGDFFHPKWQIELRENLVEFNDSNFYALKGKDGLVEKNPNCLFCLQNEIATIYSSGGKCRKVHHILYAPSMETVFQLTDVFLKRGRVDYDGRPIFGMSCAEVVDLCKGVSREIEVIPAHAWTPYFGVFGSASGFDTLEEAYDDKAKEIFAIETGLSSDPEMNWRISKLDKIALISNSDSHSPTPLRIGRECNAFNFSMEEISYKKMFDAIRTRDTSRFAYTLEVDPSYGKYHVDGHMNCSFSCEPKEAKKLNGVCPKCSKPLTIGVLHRIEALADRPEGFVLPGAIPFKKLLPLQELLALHFNSGVATKKVEIETQKIMNAFPNELFVLLEAKGEELEKVVDKNIANIILKNREGKIKVVPGFDGQYGKPMLDGNAQSATSSDAVRSQSASGASNVTRANSIPKRNIPVSRRPDKVEKDQKLMGEY